MHARHSSQVSAIRLIAAFCLLTGLFLIAFQPLLAQTELPQVRMLEVDGTITPAMASYVDRGIRDAANDTVDAVVLRIDTPGGLSSAMDDIVSDILESEVPAIAGGA